jgi:chlorobactene glucosyltransferase
VTVLAAALFAASLAGALITLGVIVGLGLKTLSLRDDRELQKLERPEDLDSYPMVSVVVPVRNEERNVEPLLRSLLELDYPPYEVLLVDDASTDRTVEIIDELRRGHEFVRVIDTTSVAKDDRDEFKSGKAWVLAQAAREAKGEWLLFVDADTRHRPDTLWRAMSFVRARELPAFSGSGIYVNPGFWGEVFEAALYIAVFFSIPLRRVHDRADREVGWMNGQFILLRRDAYEQIGGHAALKRCAQDDLAMGRLLKERDVPYRFLPGAGLYECVNYVGWREAHEGWARLIAAGTPWLGRGRPFMLGSLVLIALMALVPVFTVPLAWLTELGTYTAGLSLSTLTLIHLGLVLYLQTASRAGMKLPVWRAILFPVGAALSFVTMMTAYRIRFSGGTYMLRGRPLTPDDPNEVFR